MDCFIGAALAGLNIFLFFYPIFYVSDGYNYQ